MSQTPEETRLLGDRCPECGRHLTLGVMHRVEELSNETIIRAKRAKRPYSKLVPLVELVSHCLSKSRTAKSVDLAYQLICAELGGEVRVLTQVGYEDLKQVGGESLALAVTRVRGEQLSIVAGFDGQYGVVKPL